MLGVTGQPGGRWRIAPNATPDRRWDHATRLAVHRTARSGVITTGRPRSKDRLANDYHDSGHRRDHHLLRPMAAAPVKRQPQAQRQGDHQRMIIIALCVAGVAAVGAWLRWAVVPVRIAYGLGR